jgi:hypothetical protein
MAFGGTLELERWVSSWMVFDFEADIQGFYGLELSRATWQGCARGALSTWPRGGSTAGNGDRNMSRAPISWVTFKDMVFITPVLSRAFSQLRLLNLPWLFLSRRRCRNLTGGVMKTHISCHSVSRGGVWQIMPWKPNETYESMVTQMGWSCSQTCSSCKTSGGELGPVRWDWLLCKLPKSDIPPRHAPFYIGFRYGSVG